MSTVFRRWTVEESAAIEALRDGIGRKKLASVPPFPEVVGDRKLLRFLRGHSYDIPKCVEMFTRFLNWRKGILCTKSREIYSSYDTFCSENGVDEIRQRIVREGMNHPSKFPNGEKILSLVPQIVMAHEVSDKNGCPICIDQYTFSPTAVLEEVSVQEYIQFVIYSLEYRSLILEQLSEEEERKNLLALSSTTYSSPPSTLVKQPSTVSSSNGSELPIPPYGVVKYTCVIRDLAGVGFDHLGSRGREIISTVISLASDNYPELMRKCFIINSPFIFNTAWYFIKNLLSQR